MGICFSSLTSSIVFPRLAVAMRILRICMSLIATRKASFLSSSLPIICSRLLDSNFAVVNELCGTVGIFVGDGSNQVLSIEDATLFFHWVQFLICVASLPF